MVEEAFTASSTMRLQCFFVMQKCLLNRLRKQPERANSDRGSDSSYRGSGARCARCRRYHQRGEERT